MRTAENAKQYADACREVANSLHLPVVDIWSAFMAAAGWDEGQALAGSTGIPENSILKSLLIDGALVTSLLKIPQSSLIVLFHLSSSVIRINYGCINNSVDAGLHFTGAGYQIMYAEIMKAIRTNWPDQAPENLPMIFPAWQVAPK
jgi:isoamyl acetate esterase